MNKMKLLRLLNPVFLFLILLLPSVTGSFFHWSILAAALLVTLIDGFIIHRMIANYENLYRFSYFDSLTKIPNRLSADLYCDKINSVKDSSVAVADLDNLKITNDTYGHFAGDELLAEFASIFNSCADKDGFAARNGGDEFIVFFHGKSSAEQLTEFLTSLQDQIDAHNRTSGRCIGYSIGCAFGTSDDCASIYELISLADQRMYQQKREKKASDRKQKG